MAKDCAGKKIPSHAAWENSKQDERLDRAGKHPKEGSKSDYRMDEVARKAHNAKVKRGR